MHLFIKMCMCFTSIVLVLYTCVWKLNLLYILKWQDLSAILKCVGTVLLVLINIHCVNNIKYRYTILRFGPTVGNLERSASYA